MLGWLSHSEDRPDVKVSVICPATEVHIRKVNLLRPMMASKTVVNFSVQYSKQQTHIVRETPALYERIVRPYIDAFPATRTQWFVSEPIQVLPIQVTILQDKRYPLGSVGGRESTFPLATGGRPVRFPHFA